MLNGQDVFVLKFNDKIFIFREEVGAIMSPLVFPGRILAWDHLSMQMVENLAFSGILMSNRHQFNPGRAFTDFRIAGCHE